MDINIHSRGIKHGLDIAQISIIDTNNKELVKNNAFNQGFDYWYYYTSNYAAWSMDNLWIALYFEYGLIGVILTALILIII